MPEEKNAPYTVSIEGVLMKDQYVQGSRRIEIAPHAKVYSSACDYDERGNPIGFQTVVDDYDPRASFQAHIPLMTPLTPFSNVRYSHVTETKEEGDGTWYRVETYERTILENLDEGTHDEDCHMTFATTGQAFYLRRLEGILEWLTEEHLQTFAGTIKASKGYPVIGIRDLDSDVIRPLTFYQDHQMGTSELGRSYGNPVILEEGIWRHDIDGLGHMDTFDQRITDYTTGDIHNAGEVIADIDPLQLIIWKGEADRILHYEPKPFPKI